MACARIKLVLRGAPQCEWNGHPMRGGDQVTFRIEGDDAFIPVGSDKEERLVVLMTETKLLPPLPDAPKGLEGAVVLGLGYAPEGQSILTPMLPQPSAPAAGTSTSSSGSMTPVVAVPTTGGPPEVVIPTSPANGGVVTGVPATGGPPTTAIPVSPTTSSAADSPQPSITPMATQPVPQWIHILRVQTADKVYDLACSGRACRFDGQSIQTGDPLVLRVEKKWAYVSSASNSREERFAILSVRSLDAPAPGFPLH
jgi:hypothetical protein